MIRRLRKRISLLLSYLIGVMFVSVLLVLIWMNYQKNLNEQKRSVYSEILEIGWKDFLDQSAESSLLEDVEYGIVRLSYGGGEWEIVANYFQDRSDNWLRKSARQWNKGSEVERSMTLLNASFLKKQIPKQGKYIVVIGGKQALMDTLPFLWVCVIIGAVGIIILIMASRVLSRWLVRPVEDSLLAEKQFISNASHELKTPLTVIAANSELLSEEVGDNKHLGYIRQETEQMALLVNKMLTLAKLDTPVLEGEHRKFRVDEALLEVIDPMESVAYEKTIRLEAQIQENMQIIGSREQVKSVMAILLDNALTYTPEKGIILIRAYIKGRSFYLHVSNTGAPIPKEIRSKLFERFYRREDTENQEGSHFGLGLSIAESIAANHHGMIQVTCEDGQNCFTVILPVAKTATYRN